MPRGRVEEALDPASERGDVVGEFGREMGVFPGVYGVEDPAGEKEWCEV